jgi:hypothetical protein
VTVCLFCAAQRIYCKSDKKAIRCCSQCVGKARELVAKQHRGAMEAKVSGQSVVSALPLLALHRFNDNPCASDGPHRRCVHV